MSIVSPFSGVVHEAKVELIGPKKISQIYLQQKRFHFIIIQQHICKYGIIDILKANETVYENSFNIYSDENTMKKKQMEPIIAIIATQCDCLPMVD